MKTILTNRFLLMLLAVLFISGCASKAAVRNIDGMSGIDEHGQAVVANRPLLGIVGVVARTGVDAGASRALMATELYELISESRRYSLLRREEIARTLGAENYTAIMDNIASTGTLSQSSLRAIIKARLPVQTVIFGVIEKNAVAPGRTIKEPIRNNIGQVLTDRVRIVRTTEREALFKAVMVNLNTGMVSWSRTYSAKPLSKSSYVHYSGSSFSGSLVASLANTISNGVTAPDAPVAPSNQLTIRSLMREVVRNMP